MLQNAIFVCLLAICVLIVLLKKLLNFIIAVVKPVILKPTALTLYVIIVGKLVILKAIVFI